jgi:gas vesicle structural protein
MVMSASQPTTIGSRGSGSSGLAEVLDVLLDKGLVIDAYVRVSLVGIELLTIDARIVIASVDTYLRFAEAVNRLDLTQVGEGRTLFDLQKDGAKEKTKGALEGTKESFGDKFKPGKKREEEKEKQR